MAKNTTKSTKSRSLKAGGSPGANIKGKKQTTTKKETCISLLKRARGASLADLQKATGWQAHSVRGFLSGTVKKLAGVTLVSEQTEAGVRRYRINPAKAP